MKSQNCCWVLAHDFKATDAKEKKSKEFPGAVSY